MNKYELICQYCGFTWQINYVPKQKIYCAKCNDPKIRVIDIAAERIDQYVGCPPFPEKEQPTYDRWELMGD